LTRFATRLALLVAALGFGLATPAQAQPNPTPPTVSIVTKCGYLEITIDSPTPNTASMTFLAGAGGVTDVPIKAGVNVFKLYAADLSSGYLVIGGERAYWFGLDYREPEGCKVPKLSFAFTMACGGKALVTVTNTGEVPAEDIFIFRRQSFSPAPFAKRELVAGGLTFPVGTSYVLVDKLTDEYPYIMVNRDIDAGVYWASRPNDPRYQPPAGCAAAPKVTVAAACTGGVDITGGPANAALTTYVLGQPNDPERIGSARHVDLAKGEALLVKSGETVIDAIVYQGPPTCTGPDLPVTGSGTMLYLMAGSGLLLLGSFALVFARRRRVGPVG
jgi:LPXTG-motif cell wall-anchored protein